MSDSESEKGRHSRGFRLGTDNYLEWAVRMQAKLIRKDLWSVVEPIEEIDGAKDGVMADTSAVADKRPKKKMELARALLIEHVTKSQLSYVRDRDPRVIWTKLEKVHRSRGLATEMSLKRKFLTSQKKPTQSMQDWIGWISGIQWELEEIGVTVDDKDVILALTMGLGPTYDSFVISLDATPTDQLTLDFVIHRLLNEESRRKDREPEEERIYKVSMRTCWECGNQGHVKSDCPELKNGRRKRPGKEPEQPEKVMMVGGYDSPELA